jgi:uncharacterized delta-60 repeat protein
MKYVIGFLIATIMLVACTPNSNSSPQPTKNFELIPALETIELSPGGETSLWVKLNREGNFDDTVKMFLESLPAGVEQRWSRDTDNGDCTLILSADEFVTPGTYALDLLGEVQDASSTLNSQGLNTQQTAQLNLVINLDFLAVSVQPSILSVPRNSQTGMLVTIFGAKSNSLSLQVAPSGVTASFGEIASLTSAMTLSVSPTTPLGVHTFKVKVVTEEATSLLPVSLTVTAEPANPGFEFLTSAVSLALDRTDTKSINVFITRIKGFGQDITLSLDTSGTELDDVTASASQIRFRGLQGTLRINSDNALPVGKAIETKVKVQAETVVKEKNLTITINFVPGSLETSFGEEGVFLFDPMEQFTVLPNNQIVTAGYDRFFFKLTRINVDGSRDTSFGFDGLVGHNIQSLKDIVTIQVLPDKSFVVVSTTLDNGRVAVIKLQANGQKDTAFGDNGVFRITMPNGVGVDATAVQMDGKIIVGGDRLNTNNDLGVTLIRILANGSGIDTSFGTVTFSDLKIYELTAITLQTDGKIILAGEKGLGTDKDAVVGRLLSNGTEDNSFEGGFQSSGKAVGAYFDRFFSVALDTSQRILALGFHRSVISDPFIPFTPQLVRFKPNARLDDSFAGNGKLKVGDFGFGSVLSPASFSRHLTIQRDDKPLLIVGRTLFRFTATGAVDTSFGFGNGTVNVNVPSEIGDPIQVAVDSRGRIIVLGARGLARFVP